MCQFNINIIDKFCVFFPNWPKLNRVELTLKLRKLEPFILLEDDSEQWQDSGIRPPDRRRVAVSRSRTASSTNTNASRYIVDGPDADQSSPLKLHHEAASSFMESTV
jgi:hypothetical protein